MPLLLAALALTALVTPALALPHRDPSPEALARYRAAAAWSEARGGVALLVVEGDSVVFARAASGHRMREAYPIYSGTKGFLCPLALAAAAEGRLSLEDSAGPSFSVGDAVLPVRVRDLLDMTSGLDDAAWWTQVDGAPARRHIPEDRYAFAASLAVRFAPGSAFQYSGVHAAAFGAFLLAHGADPLRLLTRAVLAPLGIRPRQWPMDAAGHPILSHGMTLVPEQWARLGMLMRDDGVVGGRRLFAPGRLAECLNGSAAMPAYGLGWWLNAAVSEAAALQIPQVLRDKLAPPPRLFAPAPPDLFAALGSDDQRMYIIPSLGLVVVRLARADAGAEPFTDAAFLQALLR